MSNAKVYPFWVVDLVTHNADGTKSRAYIKRTLNTAALEDPKQVVEFTSALAEAERFGRDYGKRIADIRGGKLVKVTGKKKSSKKSYDPAPTRHNHIGIVVDSSYSMISVTDPTIRAFNSLLDTIQSNSRAFGQQSSLSMWTIGVPDNGSIPRLGLDGLSNEVREDFYNQTPELAKRLDRLSYKPHGSTPLLDGIGHAIDRLKTLTPADNTAYLLYVLTDGCENVSAKYKDYQIADMIKACQGSDKWTFVFMLPPGYKASFCQRYKIPEGNCIEWERSELGLQQLQAQLNVGTQGYYTMRSTGETKTRGFFTTDLSGVKPTELRRSLKDVQSKFKALTVDRETDIQSFIEDKTGQSYRKGDAYFQLTKDEKVAGHKRILVKEKSSSAIFAGDEARALLGLPKSDAKFRPGNHGNFDLFVQSVSTNRKLVRGSRILYLKPGETV